MSAGEGRSERNGITSQKTELHMEDGEATKTNTGTY